MKRKKVVSDSLSHQSFHRREGVILVEILFLLTFILLALGALAVRSKMTIKNAENHLESLQETTYTQNYHQYLRLDMEIQARKQWIQECEAKLQELDIPKESSGKTAENQKEVWEISVTEENAKYFNLAVRRKVASYLWNNQNHFRQGLMSFDDFMRNEQCRFESLTVSYWYYTPYGVKELDSEYFSSVDPQDIIFHQAIRLNRGQEWWDISQPYRVSYPDLSKEDWIFLIKNPEKRSGELSRFSSELQIKTLREFQEDEEMP